MSDVVIKAEGLGKAYQIRHQMGGYHTLRDDLINLLPGRRKSGEGKETFWALSDVSFEVKTGEVLGIIGRNGAGKSTLLKILARITRPTKGYADIYGQVGSLLEVGTGFHAELTGRENIFLSGTILGMRRSEIQRRFDEIVDFAEVEQFLDTPVKRYSSGMYMRLAFAVAAHLDPEVLIVDEVLAVGDAAFQKKSLGKMGEVAKGGRTILFVSHNMGAVDTLCSRCLWLDAGRCHAYGETHEVIGEYLAKGKAQSIWTFSEEQDAHLNNPYFSPSRLAVVDANLKPVAGDLTAGSRYGVLIEGNVRERDIALNVGFVLFTAEGERLFAALHTDVREEEWAPLFIGYNRLVAWIPPHLLNEGDYRIDLSLNLHFRAWLCEPGRNAPAVWLSIRGGLSDSPYWMIRRPGHLAPVIAFHRVDGGEDVG